LLKSPGRFEGFKENRPETWKGNAAGQGGVENVKRETNEEKGAERDTSSKKCHIMNSLEEWRGTARLFGGVKNQSMLGQDEVSSELPKTARRITSKGGNLSRSKSNLVPFQGAGKDSWRTR